MGGAAGAALIQPFGSVKTQLESGKNPTIKQIARSVIKEIKRPTTWTKILPLRMFISALSMGTAFGAISALSGIGLTKKSNIYTDLKMKPDNTKQVILKSSKYKKKRKSSDARKN